MGLTGETRGLLALFRFLQEPSQSNRSHNSSLLLLDNRGLGIPTRRPRGRKEAPVPSLGRGNRADLPGAAAKAVDACK